MIKVNAIGTIGRTLGKELFIFDEISIPLCDVINILFKYGMKNTDFSGILSDIVLAINGIAISNGIDDIILVSGDIVSLIPISHGG